ncbi:MAG: hypothetical protein E7666_02540 [Ruminococcaceae bacterium]|nr:hypothetical protein [Oscillospiraceae bacterium]
MSLKPGKYKLQLDVNVNRNLAIEEYANLRKEYPNVEARVKGRTLEYTCTRTCDFVVNDTDDCYVLFKVTISSHWNRYYDQEELNGTSFADYRVTRYHLSKLVDYRHSYEALQTSTGVLDGLCHYWTVDSVLYDYPSIEQRYVDECLQTYGAELSQYKDEEKKPPVTAAPPPKASAPQTTSSYSSGTSTYVGSAVFTEPKRTTISTEPKRTSVSTEPKQTPVSTEPRKTTVSARPSLRPSVVSQREEPKREAPKAAGNSSPVLPNGDTYIGPLKNGKRDGKGEYRYKNGDRYVGEFRNDEMTGAGKLYFANGNVYEGSFQKGKFHGTGVLTDANSRYEGEFKNGQYDGTGILTDADSRYEGEFKNGQFDGYGVRETSYGRYEGNFQNGKKHGFGIRYDVNGKKVYEGNFVNDRCEGHGHYWYDSFEYEGEFKNDDWNGYGKWTYYGGESCEGTFVNGKCHGKGIYIYSDGSRYEGDFVNGFFHGKGVYTYPNGDRYEGDFVDNKKTGRGALYFMNGNHYEGEFENGLFHGKGTFYYVIGNRLEGTCVEGKWQGRSLLYYIGGEIEEQVYDQNVLVEKRLLDEKETSKLYPFRESKGLNLQDWFYAGEVILDIPNGFGYALYPNGDVYVGQFRDGRRSGWGLHFAIDAKRVYAGQFLDRNLNGYGMEIDSNRNACFGVFENGIRKQPLGNTENLDYRFLAERMTDPLQMGTFNGSVYFAPLCNGYFHYAGVQCYASGVKYIGQYENGYAKGAGIYLYPDGSFYVGMFENSQMNGYGMKVNHGFCKFGRWENNLFIG